MEKKEGVASGTMFIREIMNMMHAFGDNPCPFLISAQLVETILYEQLELLLYKAHEVAEMRESRWIGFEDIVFLMRRDRLKLNRLLNYVATKDFKAHALCDLPSDVLGDSSQPEIEREPYSKRKQTCMEFLETLDHTGELTDKNQPFDPVKKERLIRAEAISQYLDENGYYEYAGARRTSFIYRAGRGNKIQEWLLANTDKFPDLPRNDPLLYEMLAYLAHETVAQIVDLALLVRQDGASKPGDVFSYYMAGYTRMPGSYPPQYASELTGKQLTGPPPLTPPEIKEALRRYWSPQLCPWSPFSRTLPRNMFIKPLVF